jgi:hypothetical protein
MSCEYWWCGRPRSSAGSAQLCSVQEFFGWWDCPSGFVEWFCEVSLPNAVRSRACRGRRDRHLGNGWRAAFGDRGTGGGACGMELRTQPQHARARTTLQSATGTNRIHLGLCGMQSRTFGPCLASNDRIIIPVMAVQQCAPSHSTTCIRCSRVCLLAAALLAFLLRCP